MIKVLKFMRISAIVTMIVIPTFLSLPGYSSVFTPGTEYQVCFTPGQDCTALITSEILNAKKSIYVQAYSFTSPAIAKALSDAKHKGVSVNIILDKSQIKHNQYSSATYFQHQNIPLYIDNKPAIAHNKVMIIDEHTVITGSFNFTKAAQEKNAENVIVIHDAGLAALYLANWNKRRELSIQVSLNKNITPPSA